MDPPLAGAAAMMLRLGLARGAGRQLSHAPKTSAAQLPNQDHRPLPANAKDASETSSLALVLVISPTAAPASVQGVPNKPAAS